MLHYHKFSQIIFLELDGTEKKNSEIRRNGDIYVKDKIQKETVFGTSNSLSHIHGIRDINVLNKIYCTGKIR